MSPSSSFAVGPFQVLSRGKNKPLLKVNGSCFVGKRGKGFPSTPLWNVHARSPARSLPSFSPRFCTWNGLFTPLVSLSGTNGVFGQVASMYDVCAKGEGRGGGSKNAPIRWIQSIVLKIRTTWGPTKSKILWMSYAAELQRRSRWIVLFARGSRELNKVSPTSHSQLYVLTAIHT